MLGVRGGMVVSVVSVGLVAILVREVCCVLIGSAWWSGVLCLCLSCFCRFVCGCGFVHVYFWLFVVCVVGCLLIDLGLCFVLILCSRGFLA